MNAILVFDPANDLLFVKSDRLFRLKLLRYSRQMGLFTASPSDNNQNNPSSSRQTSDIQTARHHQRPSPRSKQLKCRCKCQCKIEKSNKLDKFHDLSKGYLDILMLLLTPYVASLRLSNNLSHWARRGNDEEAQMKDLDEKQARNEDKTQDLLGKFMSSINLNHECQQSASILPDTDKADADDDDDDDRQPFSVFEATTEEPRTSSQPSVGVKMPLECLEDCQVVFCELNEFMFIYLQELSDVSSFKLRLMQKRIDLFARLSCLLFGQTLNSLARQQIQLDEDEQREHDDDYDDGDGDDHHHHNHYHHNDDHRNHYKSIKVNQAQILRQAYDCWFEQQFEADFLLEALERLIVGKQIELLVQETLRKISMRLRSLETIKLARNQSSSSWSFGETHQHALLFSGNKLVSRFSCLNSPTLTSNDLMLLLILLRTFNKHHDNDLTAKHDTTAHLDEPNKKGYCFYESNFATNRHTNQIGSSLEATAAPTLHARATTTTTVQWCQKGCLFCAKLREKRQQVEAQLGAKFPSQFPVFLSLDSKDNKNIRIPHMIRFVALVKGVTLILISEISATSYLAYHLGKVHRLLMEFSLSLAPLADKQNARQHSSSNNKLEPLKLNQLAQVNDCVSAIKSYFLGQNFDEISTSATSGDNLTVDDSPDQQQVESSRSLLSNLFGKYFSSKESATTTTTTTTATNNESNQTRRPTNILFHSLGARQRRMCRHLLRRLNEFASNNVQTYMKQTFNLRVDDHKREALLGSVSGVVRQSLSSFILESQLIKLNQVAWREFAGLLLDQVKLLAREQLSDYLDYLAVKATCNVTLGAPLTHDMSAIRSFIYVDRQRQQLVVSPLQRSPVRLTMAELTEGDFSRAIAHAQRRRRHQLNRSATLTTSAGDSGAVSEPSDEEDAYSSSSSSASPVGGTDHLSTFQSHSSSGDESDDDDDDDGDESSGGPDKANQDTPATPANKPEHIRWPQKHSTSWLLGTSHDVLTTNNTSSSSMATSSRKSVLNNSTSEFNLSPGGTGRRAPAGSSLRRSNSSSRVGQAASSAAATSTEQVGPTHEHHKDDEWLARQTHLSSSSAQHLVDENLTKGFTSFIYNRLAAGKTSLKTSDGTYTLSYFLWFKRNSVRSR